MQTEQQRTETGAETPLPPPPALSRGTLMAPTAPPASAVLIREYTTVAEYAADAAARAAEGWRLLSVIPWDQRAGFWRGVLLMLWALVWRPAPHILATFVREG